MHGLALTKYGARAASTRQRVMQFLPALAAEGITLELAPLFDNAYLDALMDKGERPLAPLPGAYLARMMRLLTARRHDFLWVHYELFPYLPGLFEMLVKLSCKPVVYDYDDATFHLYDQQPNPLVRGLLAGKLAPLLRRSNLAICGNAYLQHYAQQFCAQTAVIPTVVDVSRYQVKPAGPPQTPVIGWIGSPSTWSYGVALAPTLVPLVAAGEAQMLVVGAGKAVDTSLPFQFRAWEEAREVADIQAMDIGVMPLPDEPWARGKCGYKLIQYMACGLPVIASPVGVNREIVQHGVNGFLANNEQEWREAIETLLGDAALRRLMGAASRARVEADYSLQRYAPELARLVRGAVDPRSPLASRPTPPVG